MVQAAWETLQQTGWDHPAWREAYSLAQLCLAAAYTFQDSNAAPAGCTRLSPVTAGDHHAHHTSTATLDHASQTAAEPTAHMQPPLQLAQTTFQFAPSRPQLETGSSKQESCNGNGNSHKSGSPEQKGSQQSRPQQASPGEISHAMKAMQALDMASIMGAPPDMLAPVLHSTEPLARQAHQASLALQNEPSYQAAHKATKQGGTVSQSEQSSEQHSTHESLGHLCTAVPEDMPAMDPDNIVSREDFADLTAAKFRKLYWKTDTPVIITGWLLVTGSCVRSSLNCSQKCCSKQYRDCNCMLSAFCSPAAAVHFELA